MNDTASSGFPKKSGPHGESGDADTGIDTTLKRIQEITDKQSKQAWLWGGVTLVLGVALLLAAHPPLDEKSSWKFASDIGISLVIAALVGIFYDVFNKQTGRTKEKLKMEDNVRSLIKLGGEIEDLLKQLDMSNDPLRKIKTTLEQRLSPTSEYRAIIAGLDKFLEDILAIHQIRNELNVDEGREYLQCVGWVLEKYTVQSAAQARTVLEGMQTKGNLVLQHAFFPPERRQLTLEILSAQLRALHSDDASDSVVNVWLYVDMSKGFIDAMHAAMDKGAKVRRIFNLCREQVGDEANLKKAIRLTQAHIKEFDGKNFEYRYLKLSTLDCLDPEILQGGDVGDIDQLKSTYFAHFCHLKEQKALRFVPSFAGPEMQGVAMKVYSMGIRDFEYEAKTALFNHLWDKCDQNPPASARPH